MKHTPALGLCIMYPAPGVIERIGPDWDWIWLDAQHGQIAGYTELLAMVRACNLVQRPAFVRVASHERGPISLALDMRAEGIIVPQVDTPEQAHALVQAAKFPPVGDRSYGARRSIDFEGRTYNETANERSQLICQIESQTALTNAEKIAAIPGVDALFLGPDDLFLRKGCGMDQPRDPQILQEAMQQVVAACRKQGKKSITVGVGKDSFLQCLHAGFDYIVAGGDVPFLALGSKAASTEARALITSSEAAGKNAPGSPQSPY